MAYRNNQKMLVCKNSRQFFAALERAADGDGNASIMFMDNFNGENEKIVIQLIEKRKFTAALLAAFKFKDTREGGEFWSEVALKIKAPPLPKFDDIKKRKGAKHAARKR
jgi:hypothetical protein